MYVYSGGQVDRIRGARQAMYVFSMIQVYASSWSRIDACVHTCIFHFVFTSVTKIVAASRTENHLKP